MPEKITIKVYFLFMYKKIFLRSSIHHFVDGGCLFSPAQIKNSQFGQVILNRAIKYVTIKLTLVLKSGNRTKWKIKILIEMIRKFSACSQAYQESSLKKKLLQKSHAH